MKFNSPHQVHTSWEAADAEHSLHAGKIIRFQNSACYATLGEK